MEAHHVAALHELLAATPWVDRAEELARALRHTRDPGGLLLVGTPDEEPWHLTAHLDDESRYAELPQLTPTLVRWEPALDAPAHLRVGLDRLADVRRGETLFVVSPEAEVPVPLLERVDDARRTGATILALDQGDRELVSLAHDSISLDPATDPLSFESLQHLVSTAAGHPREQRRPGLRERLNRFLDVVSGPRIGE